MKHIAIKSAAALLLSLLLSWGYLFMPQTFFSLNDKLRDFLFLTRGELPRSERIVIIDIDEKALNQFGQWPWPRKKVAELLTRLHDAGAGVIGLDIVFAEADRSSPHRIASQIKADAAELENYDDILAQTLKKIPTIIGGYIFTFEPGYVNEEPMIPAVFIEKRVPKDKEYILNFDLLQNSLYSIGIPKPKGIILNLDLLQDSLYSSGFFNMFPDEGGMVRRVPMIIRYDGSIYPSLVLEMVRIYKNVSTVEVYENEMGVEKIQLADLSIPTDNTGRLIVNFRGPKKHFTYISAADILNGSFNPKEIAGKFILVGTSAIGLFDIRSIPFDSAIAGVEVHANVLDNILEGDFIYEPYNAVTYNLLLIWGIVFALIFLFSYLSPWLLLPAAAAVAFALFELFFHTLFTMHIVLNLFFPLLAFILTLILSVSIDYIIASRQREAIKRMFAKKVSKAVMDDLIRHADEDILKVRDADVAVFFSDIRGFTGISETIESSQKLVALLNRYMTPVVDEIANPGGTVDKFIGDAIMAYWNAPNYVEDYADKAVDSALAQIKILRRLNIKLEKEFGVTLRIGIGVHCGKVTVGEMGSAGRSDYTIIGDNVNLASRLEGLNKLYGTTIIISADTKNRLKKHYTLRSLDLVRVKGRSKVVEVFEVISPEDAIGDDELRHYETAVGHYRSGKFSEAFGIFSALLTEHDSTLYRLYLERCQTYLDNPQASFDGIYTMHEK